jgi:hypothetical protein
MTALYQIANDFAKLSDSGMEPEMIADTLDGIVGAGSKGRANPCCM